MKLWLVGLTLLVMWRNINSQGTFKCTGREKTDNFKLDLTIFSSPRPPHLIISHIIRLILKEALRFNVNLVIDGQDDHRIYEYENKTVKGDAQIGAINMELWLDAHHTLDDRVNYDGVINVGPLKAIAREGIFYFKHKESVADECDFEYYKFLQNETCAALFSLDNNDRVIKEFFFNNLTQEYEYHFKGDQNFVPEVCKRERCGTLLGDYNYANRTAIQHLIKSLNLRLVVVWLEKNFEKEVDLIKGQTNKHLLFYDFYPSYNTIKTKPKAKFIFFPCYMKWSDSEDSLDICPFEFNQIQKVVTKSLQENAPEAYNLVQKATFDQKVYESILEDIYDVNGKGDKYEDAACKWLNEKKFWADWLPRSLGQNLSIGVFLDESELYKGNLESILELLTSHIENHPSFLKKYSLEIIRKPHYCSSASVIPPLVDLINVKQKNFMGIIGPGCPATVETTLSISEIFNWTVISYNSETDSLYNSSNYFTMVPDTYNLLYIYSSLLKKLNKTKLGILIQDAEKQKHLIKKIKDRLKVDGVVTIKEGYFTNLSISEMNTSLDNLKKEKAKYIFGHFSSSAAREIMCLAYKKKMTATYGYTWLLTSWNENNWWISGNSQNCTVEQMEEAIKGHWEAKYVSRTPNGTKLDYHYETPEKWQDSYDTILRERNLNEMVFDTYLYDAVWALSMDFLNMTEGIRDKSPQIYQKDKYAEIIEEREFTGISGLVSFKKNRPFPPINIYYFRNGKEEGRVHIATFRNSLDQEIDVTTIPWVNNDVPDDGAESEEEKITCTFEFLAKLLNVPCNTATFIFGGVLGALLLIILIALIVFFVNRRYAKKLKLQEERLKALGLTPENSFSSLDNWELPRDKVIINRKIGEGAFGTVYGGEAQLPNQGWTDVAVKTLKEDSTSEQKLDFLSEAEIMKQFDHSNVVQLYGVCVKVPPVLAIMEFMLYGDLKTYLLGRRSLVSEPNRNVNDEISDKRLTLMALDIARGLSYLCSLKFVHRDLACRNCLVNRVRTVKIGDFGMCRAMYDSDYYKFNKKGMLPVRWMAPESLTDGLFTHKSDIWSFGVILFELLTFGSIPYQGLSNSQVLDYVKDKNCLTAPRCCKPKLKALLARCWGFHSIDRPDAFDIAEVLAAETELVTPCLDSPISSVDLDNSMEKSKLRKSLPLHRRRRSRISLDDRIERETKEVGKVIPVQRNKMKNEYINMQDPKATPIQAIEPFHITTHI